LRRKRLRGGVEVELDACHYKAGVRVGDGGDRGVGGTVSKRLSCRLGGLLVGFPALSKQVDTVPTA
jgi:hypothetical protein